MTEIIALTLLAFLSFALVAVVRVWVIRQSLFDHPNYRSLHSIPTPRGGGLAVVIAFLLALIYLTLAGKLALNTFVTLGGGGAVVAAIGYWDDRQNLPVKTRLVGQFGAAIWAVIWVGGIKQLDLGFVTWNWGWLGSIVSVFGIIWLLNLYNFMDGIDGMAASEAVFVASSSGLFLLNDGAYGLALACLSLAATCVGFLFWNWPPAKIFMGDVCSSFLGYVLAVLIIVSNHTTDISPWVWLLLLGVFVVDATVTLLRRLLRGEKLYQAHRSHAYQHATILLGSHLKVTSSVLGINVLILFPTAFVAWSWPDFAFVVAGGTSLFLMIVALHLNAGKS